MPTLSDVAFVPYGKRYKYPGMMPLDEAIWERFIAENPSAFDECAYNVAVGGGTEMDTIVNPTTGGDVNRLYQRKIDVIGKVAGGYIITEIKPRATTSAVGQVKGYKRLFERDMNPDGFVDALVITDQLMPDIEFLAKEEGVKIIVA